ncbi:NKAP family protein CG6066-like isoform X9 [Dreissena polymorpha]|uniref:NKAP family protein CG6066-like isoform X8 n=1 Tax=Dreissena polymorpha TaxID=45954 RepID=UPI0022655E6C|nr:NKAP family protein CG6066-like isoform X8 [Dreissena polymorpha]XP_052266200.1 NKAP family protein CG6066-like isoform X9 [Dreissena polymorpha]
MDIRDSPPAKNKDEGDLLVTMKRGRGRPRKIESSMMKTSDEVMDNRPQKRQRTVYQNDKHMESDRLRKKMRLSYAEPSDGDSFGDDFSESGFESETDNEIPGYQTGPKKDARGRGRPRKSEHLEVKSKKGRGRPRKIQQLLRAEDVGDRIHSIEAELFGPKKQIDNNMPPEVKGKRGRPKKLKERKRGRPRKSIETSEDEKPEKVPSERGRGRPKGSTKKTVDESSTSSEDSFDATDKGKIESSEESSDTTSSSDDSSTSHEEIDNTKTEPGYEKEIDKAEVTKKGKRGRPKKLKERKRGRPRKSIETSEDEKDLTWKPYTEDGVKSGRGRPKNPLKIRPEKVPGRGRGRPKNPFKPEKVPSERGRGRPKGSTKKPRGRPPQKHQTVDESSTSSEATNKGKIESSEESSDTTSSSDDSSTSHEEIDNTKTESGYEKESDKTETIKSSSPKTANYNQEKDSDKKAEKSGHKQGGKLNDIKETKSLNLLYTGINLSTSPSPASSVAAESRKEVGDSHSLCEIPVM